METNIIHTENEEKMAQEENKQRLVEYKTTEGQVKTKLRRNYVNIDSGNRKTYKRSAYESDDPQSSDIAEAKFDLVHSVTFDDPDDINLFEESNLTKTYDSDEKAMKLVSGGNVNQHVEYVFESEQDNYRLEVELKTNLANYGAISYIVAPTAGDAEYLTVADEYKTLTIDISFITVDTRSAFISTLYPSIDWPDDKENTLYVKSFKIYKAAYALVETVTLDSADKVALFTKSLVTASYDASENAMKIVSGGGDPQHVSYVFTTDTDRYKVEVEFKTNLANYGAISFVKAPIDTNSSYLKVDNVYTSLTYSKLLSNGSHNVYISTLYPTVGWPASGANILYVKTLKFYKRLRGSIQIKTSSVVSEDAMSNRFYYHVDLPKKFRNIKKIKIKSSEIPVYRDTFNDLPLDFTPPAMEWAVDYEGWSIYASSSGNTVTGNVLNVVDKSLQTFWISEADLYDSTTGIYEGDKAITLADGSAMIGEWIKFRVPRNSSLRKYLFAPGYGLPLSTKVLGSNDDITYTLLREDNTYSSPLQLGINRESDDTEYKPFRYFVFLFSSATTGYTYVEVNMILPQFADSERLLYDRQFMRYEVEKTYNQPEPLLDDYFKRATFYYDNFYSIKYGDSVQPLNKGHFTKKVAAIQGRIYIVLESLYDIFITHLGIMNNFDSSYPVEEVYILGETQIFFTADDSDVDRVQEDIGISFLYKKVYPFFVPKNSLFVLVYGSHTGETSLVYDATSSTNISPMNDDFKFYGTYDDKIIGYSPYLYNNYYLGATFKYQKASPTARKSLTVEETQEVIQQKYSTQFPILQVADQNSLDLSWLIQQNMRLKLDENTGLARYHYTISHQANYDAGVTGGENSVFIYDRNHRLADYFVDGVTGGDMLSFENCPSLGGIPAADLNGKYFRCIGVEKPGATAWRYTFETDKQAIYSETKTEFMKLYQAQQYKLFNITANGFPNDEFGFQDIGTTGNAFYAYATDNLISFGVTGEVAHTAPLDDYYTGIWFDKGDFTYGDRVYITGYEGDRTDNIIMNFYEGHTLYKMNSDDEAAFGVTYVGGLGITGMSADRAFKVRIGTTGAVTPSANTCFMEHKRINKPFDLNGAKYSFIRLHDTSGGYKDIEDGGMELTNRFANNMYDNDCGFVFGKKLYDNSENIAYFSNPVGGEIVFDPPYKELYSIGVEYKNYGGKYNFLDSNENSLTLEIIEMDDKPIDTNVSSRRGREDFT